MHVVAAKARAPDTMTAPAMSGQPAAPLAPAAVLAAPADPALIGDHQRLMAFTAALEAEKQALIDGRTDDLAALSQHKLQCAQSFEREVTPAFTALLKDTGQRLRRGVAASSADALALHRQVQAAQELNQLNGKLIAQHLGQIGLRLSRIEPVNPARQTYGRNGLGNSSRPGRSFGAA